MKALTIRQPWAQLTLMLDPSGMALKRVETRSRRTNYRGRIAIHAGLADEIFFSRCFARKEQPHLVVAGFKSDMDIHKLPHGAVIGEVTIADCVPIEELWGTLYCTERERAFGDWSKRRFGWILEDPVMYAEPVPARGQLGLWNWEGKT